MDSSTRSMPRPGKFSGSARSRTPALGRPSVSVIALDARTGKLKSSYQLRANDDHDWDTTVVSLFDSDHRAVLATAGKDGVLHVIDRSNGKRVFSLPVTTTLNQDVPVSAE